MDKWQFNPCGGYEMDSESLSMVVKCLEDNIYKCSDCVILGYSVICAILVINRHKGRYVYNINYIMKKKGSDVFCRNCYVKNVDIRLQSLEKLFKFDCFQEYWFKRCM